jgi:hypothetical protein
MWAYQVTCGMDLSGIFQFVSAAKPGSTHDIELLSLVKEELESGLEEHVVLLCWTRVIKASIEKFRKEHG